MKVYDKITDLIGKTPLLKLTNYIDNNKLDANIYAKNKVVSCALIRGPTYIFL